MLVWGGQLVSLLGSSAATTVLSLAVFTHSGRVVDLATVIAVKFAVGVYTAPLVGRIIDHCSRRVALSWCDGALACSSVTLGLLLSAGGPPIGIVVVLVAVSGVFDGAVSLLLVSSVRQLRREADLTRVNGLVTVIENAPLLLGPSLGAVLYTWARRQQPSTAMRRRSCSPWLPHSSCGGPRSTTLVREPGCSVAPPQE